MLNLSPTRIGSKAGTLHLRQRRERRIVQRACHVGTLDSQATRSVLGVSWIECHAPEVWMLEQALQDILKVHQAHATVQISTQVPGFQAAAQCRQLRRWRLRSTPLQHIRQHQFGQIDLVVHHHLLQISAGQLVDPTQSLQCIASARPQGLVFATDQR
ncbi:hypothetical protein D3C77_527600 [compost metagenome]